VRLLHDPDAQSIAPPTGKVSQPEKRSEPSADKKRKVDGSENKESTE
jgi:hypothetical protein